MTRAKQNARIRAHIREEMCPFDSVGIEPLKVQVKVADVTDAEQFPNIAEAIANLEEGCERLERILGGAGE